MKRKLSFMSNEEGFFLPYVLVVTAIVLIIITSSINIYHQDIFMTEKHLGQIKVETLIQMGREKLKQDVIFIEGKENSVYYNFPHGDIKIVYTKVNDNEYVLHFTVFTGEIKYVGINYLLM